MKTNQQLSPQIETVLLQEHGELYHLENNFSENEVEIYEKNNYKKYFKLEYIKDGKQIISAKNYAGILVLPNHIIKIEPKIPNASFFGMLKYALSLPEILSKEFPITEKTDFWEILIVIFLKRLKILFQRNLHSDYVDAEENLNLIRGKIDFTQNLIQNFDRPDKIYCRFTEFTRNVLENQLIKTTLHKLIFGVKYDLYSEDMKNELNDFYRRFDFADLVIGNPIESFNLITITQLNQRYEKILEICKLLLKEQSFELGKIDSKSNFEIIVNMDDLFEDFIWKMLETKKLDIEHHRSVYWDKDENRSHTPDFLLRKNNRKFILDTKYYEEKNHDSNNNLILDKTERSIPIENIGQLVFYSNSSGIKNLGLLYPGKHKPNKIEIKNDIHLYIFHIDIEGKTPSEFENNCEELKNQLVKII